MRAQRGSTVTRNSTVGDSGEYQVRPAVAVRKQGQQLGSPHTCARQQLGSPHTCAWQQFGSPHTCARRIKPLKRAVDLRHCESLDQGQQLGSPHTFTWQQFGRTPAPGDDRGPTIDLLISAPAIRLVLQFEQKANRTTTRPTKRIEHEQKFVRWPLFESKTNRTNDILLVPGPLCAFVAAECCHGTFGVADNSRIIRSVSPNVRFVAYMFERTVRRVCGILITPRIRQYLSANWLSKRIESKNLFG